MAKPKKTSSKKTSVKASAKKQPAKKAVARKSSAAKPPVKKKKASKTTQAKRPAKKVAASQTEERKLHQDFTNSLKMLVNYWDKQAVRLKKQLDTLRAKQAKALEKPKAKSKSVEEQLKAELELAQLHQTHDHATSQANKYAALSNMIAQFEQGWAHHGEAKNKFAASPSSLPQEAENMRLADESAQDEEVFEEEYEAEADEDLEDIFMPQDDLSEFEVIEDFNSDIDEDNYDEYS